MVIVKKPLDKGTLFYTADAVWARRSPRRTSSLPVTTRNGPGAIMAAYMTHTKDFAEFSDADGMVITSGDNGDDEPAADAKEGG